MAAIIESALPDRLEVFRSFQLEQSNQFECPAFLSVSQMLKRQLYCILRVTLAPLQRLSAFGVSVCGYD